MIDIENKAEKLLKELNIKNLKSEAKQTNILLQKLLQKLMLIYTVDIAEQVAQKQADVISSYPTELISSLKNIADLYFKMKEQNKLVQVKDDKDRFSDDYVF